MFKSFIGQSRRQKPFITHVNDLMIMALHNSNGSVGVNWEALGHRDRIKDQLSTLIDIGEGGAVTASKGLG